MVDSRRFSVEVNQFLRRPSTLQARRVSTPVQILWLQTEQQFDPLLDPIWTPQSIRVGDSPHGDGVVDKLRRVIDSDSDTSHEPRPLFCELLVFCPEDASPSEDDFEFGRIAYWRETSRWIKFEETVEQGGSRWSKPHVTLLNVQRLLQIRSCLQKHATLLDVDARSFGHVVELCASTWEKRHHLQEDELRAVKDALMSSKRHLVKTRMRSETSMPYEDVAVAVIGTTEQDGAVSDHHAVNATNDKASGSKVAINQSLLRKLPEDSESACVFVGYVENLRCPVAEFVRLKDANIFNDISELPIPTRFIFALLIPSNHIEQDGIQIGRCMGALFVDEVFSQVCYKARQGYELAFAVDEIMSQSVVIPPEKWNPSCRLEPPEFMTPVPRPVLDGPARNAIILTTKGTSLAEQEPSDVARSGRLFGGLIEDIKHKSAWYVSDFTDATRGRLSQTIAAAVFLFFANISKIITFGGVMGNALDDYIGAIENVIAGGICGVVYALFSGQPLCVLSATGPCLVFEVVLYKLSSNMEWDFLVVRSWVGIWTAVVLLILVAIDASAMVALITRFTEEAFATMISIIFLIKAVEELLEISHHYPVITDPGGLMNETCSCLGNENLYTASIDPAIVEYASDMDVTTSAVPSSNQCKQYVPDVFMFSIILFCFTFVIAFGLKMLRNSRFFPTKIREILADFNVTIAIAVMSLVNTMVGLQVPCLEVPDRFQPTRLDRGWFVNPFALKQWWLAVATVLPAIFFSILVMMDQNITSVIINRKENKLLKGYGYHLDLTVIAVLMVVCSVLGIPFYVAATVISLMHVHSLRVTSETVAPGETPQFLGLREQRVTALLAHILVGLAVFLTPVMKHIPMPVLLGVFLYMGIVSLAGQQFVMRLLVLLMPAKHQPDYSWLRLVRLKRVNLFTVIQLISLVFLMVVEEIKTVSMLFPLMLVIMIFIRKWLLGWIFTAKELFALDDPLAAFREIWSPNKENMGGSRTPYTEKIEPLLPMKPTQKPAIVISDVSRV